MMPVLFRERIPEVEVGSLTEGSAGLTGATRCGRGLRRSTSTAPTPRPDRRPADRPLVPAADAVGLEVADLANVGGPDDYRIPDAVVYRAEAGDRSEPYLTSVELIVEIRSPDPDPVAKLPFYRHHGAGEAVLVNPATATVQWLAIQGDGWTASTTATCSASTWPSCSPTSWDEGSGAAAATATAAGGATLVEEVDEHVVAQVRRCGEEGPAPVEPGELLDEVA